MRSRLTWKFLLGYLALGLFSYALIASVSSWMIEQHTINRLGHAIYDVDGSHGFLYQFFTIIVNSIDIPMVDFLPQPLELILAGIIIQMIIDGFCRLVGIFNHVCKGCRVEDTLYQLMHLLTDGL